MSKKLIFATVLCFVSLGLTFVIFNNINNSKKFEPPRFEENKSYGIPKVANEYQWGIIDANNFLVGMCGNVYLEEKTVIYFTNPTENSVWLKLRLLDEKGNIHGETGLIKPGEYVEFVYLDNKKQPNGKISFKIMAYEPETYYSQGSIIVNPQILQMN